jgi:hypothetical protein
VRPNGMHLSAIIAAAAIAAACGSSSSNPNNGSTTFDGVIVGDSASGELSGSITLTIATVSLSVSSPAVFDITGVAASANVTGTLKIQGGGSIALTGSYDTNSHALSVSGGGYSFSGSFSNNALSGTFTAPGGGSGSFSTSATSGSGAVYSFCGAAVATTGKGGATFNLVINTGAGTATGFASSSDGVTNLNGTATSSTWSISFLTVKNGDPGTASGTYTSSSLTGTYSIPNQSESGTVNGTICQ